MAASLPSPGAANTAVKSPFRAPTRLPRSNSRNRSPPLAFEKTPNDALAPLISPPDNRDLNPFESMSPQVHNTGLGSYQDVIDRQASTIDALHAAFAAEREAWACERRQLFSRISNFERLLRAQNGHSPARSPLVSPTSGTISSPQARAVSGYRLPSITEDENIRPLSERRSNAPRVISIPTIETVEELDEDKRRSLLIESAAAQLDELSVSPPQSAAKESPFPVESTAFAGRTPLKHPVRPPTPPPRQTADLAIEDTPTRNNTHINSYLTQTNVLEEEDHALTGPLNMPELPGLPTADNFTEEMLFKKLEQIAQDPQRHKPTVFSSPSPGLALPNGDGDDQGGAGLSPGTLASASEHPLAPVPTRDAATAAAATPFGHLDDMVDSAHQDSVEEAKFAQGGIRLKKKPSSNFGAPFGQLTGFGRKLS